MNPLQKNNFDNKMTATKSVIQEQQERLETMESKPKSLERVTQIEQLKRGCRVSCDIHKPEDVKELLNILCDTLHPKRVIGTGGHMDVFAHRNTIRSMIFPTTWKDVVTEVSELQRATTEFGCPKRHTLVFFEENLNTPNESGLWSSDPVLPDFDPEYMSLVIFAYGPPSFTNQSIDYVIQRKKAADYCGGSEWVIREHFVAEFTSCPDSSDTPCRPDSLSDALASRGKPTPKALISTEQLFRELQQGTSLFQLDDLPQAGIFVCLGSAGLELATNLARHFWQQPETNYVVLAGPRGVQNIQLPSPKTVLRPSPDTSKDILRRIVEHQTQAKDAGQKLDHIVVLLESGEFTMCTSYLEAANLNIALIVSIPHLGRCTCFQEKIDYLFMQPDADLATLNKDLWESVFHRSFVSLQGLQQRLDKQECLVYDRSRPETLFQYKAT